MAKIIITCTQPRADMMVADLQAGGFDAMALPALVKQEIHTPMPEGNFDAMLITSRHAITSRLPRLPVIAVGDETAHIARDNNFNVIETGDGGAKDLDLSSFSKILYPCAQEPSTLLQNTVAWPVYATVEHPDFINRLNLLSGGIIALYSGKAAAVFKRINTSKKWDVLCFSSQIADVLHDVPLNSLATCARPDYDMMKDLMKERLQK